MIPVPSIMKVRKKSITLRQEKLPKNFAGSSYVTSLSSITVSLVLEEFAAS